MIDFHEDIIGSSNDSLSPPVEYSEKVISSSSSFTVPGNSNNESMTHDNAIENVNENIEDGDDGLIHEGALEEILLQLGIENGTQMNVDVEAILHAIGLHNQATHDIISNNGGTSNTSTVKTLRDKTNADVMLASTAWKLVGVDPSYRYVDASIDDTFSPHELRNIHSFTPLQGEMHIIIIFIILIF